LEAPPKCSTAAVGADLVAGLIATGIALAAVNEPDNDTYAFYLLLVALPASAVALSAFVSAGYGFGAVGRCREVSMAATRTRAQLQIESAHARKEGRALCVAQRKQRLEKAFATVEPKSRIAQLRVLGRCDPSGRTDDSPAVQDGDEVLPRAAGYLVTGLGIMVNQATDVGTLAEAGLRIPTKVDLSVRVGGAYGRSSVLAGHGNGGNYSEQGAFFRAEAGLDVRICGGRGCALLGLSGGYHRRSSPYTNRAGSAEVTSSPLFGPRIGVELGAGEWQVRGGLEVGTQRSSVTEFAGGPSVGSEWTTGFGVSTALVYRFLDVPRPRPHPVVPPGPTPDELEEQAWELVATIGITAATGSCEDARGAVIQIQAIAPDLYDWLRSRDADLVRCIDYRGPTVLDEPAPAAEPPPPSAP